VVEQKSVLIIAGPTASGKSSLALSLAERFGGEIVNADSMQVYQEFRVLTARPTKDDEVRVPHHLYGFESVSSPCSAGSWLGRVVPVIEDIFARDNIPVVCGGTGLYLKVLQEGIAPVPDIPEGAVRELGDMYAEIGGDAFRQRLAERDPVGAAKLEPGDRQRLIRALVVVMETGRTLDQWQSAQNPEPPLDARFFIVHLIPPRDQLYRRIENRFEQMIEQGALDEVRAVHNLGLDAALPALKALGVPDFQNHLINDTTLEEAVDKAKQRTRNFAKRQLTWFRNQSAADLVIEGFGGDHALSVVCASVEGFLDI
jgi:tRNA dimethylallyltransferase